MKRFLLPLAVCVLIFGHIADGAVLVESSVSRSVTAVVAGTTDSRTEDPPSIGYWTDTASVVGNRATTTVTQASDFAVTGANILATGSASADSVRTQNSQAPEAVDGSGSSFQFDFTASEGEVFTLGGDYTIVNTANGTPTVFYQLSLVSSGAILASGSFSTEGTAVAFSDSYNFTGASALYRYSIGTSLVANMNNASEILASYNNLEVAVVPEPSVGLFLLSAFGSLLLFRSRTQS